MTGCRFPNWLAGSIRPARHWRRICIATRSRTSCRSRLLKSRKSAKLLENIYRAVNIALVNEVKLILTEMDIDVWEVIKAASTKPFGFQAFYPGPGLGGHCIPIDPFYLAWKAREVGVPTRFIELAGEINRGMPDYVVRRTALALNERKKSLRESAVLILGVAYKPNIDDVRESPGIEVIEKLSRLGAKVAYNDPHVPRTPKMRRHDLGLASVAWIPKACKNTIVSSSLPIMTPMIGNDRGQCKAHC